MSNREVPIRDWDDDDDDDGTEPSETEASTIRDDSSEHDAEDSSDEYVDARASHRLKKQYLQTKKTAPRASREPQGGRPVVLTYKSPPRRSTRPKRVRTTASTSTLRNATLSPSAFNTVKTEDDDESDHRVHLPFRLSSEAVPDNITAARWQRRVTEEARPHSFADPFFPTVDDVARWKSGGCPGPFIIPKKRSRTAESPHPEMMHAHIENSPSRRSNNIVEEYLSPSESFNEDYSVFKHLSDAEKQDVIRREAEEHGMEKPKGYTVSFHYNPHVEYHHFGSSHPMKPWRLTLTKQLVVAYGLEYTMDLYEPRPATFDEVAIFHDREYTSFLNQITPQNMKQHEDALINFGFAGESNDCPVFEGLWNYVCLYSGASMHAAQNLLNQQSEIAINWSGGLHHARKGAASGFCYVNDIVLAIQHLLTQHQRVLYIDIDVHHGDGVEAAFESSDRVFTLSYHKFGPDRINGWPFFPGTGSIDDTGPSDPTNRGKGHALNIPIDDGIDDEQYQWLFKTITGAVVEKYRPGAIVLQSGADSLGGDRLGRFNLNIKAHGFCVETVKGYGKPLLLIGGGGYTPRNVARTWCHETSVCVGATLHNDLPTHLPYIQAFQGEENGGGILYPELHNTKRHDNLNDVKSLNKIVERALENLRYLEGAPSVVVNTMGLDEEQIMKIREQIDRELEDERDDRIHAAAAEKLRRTRERNTGGRGERGLR